MDVLHVSSVPLPWQHSDTVCRLGLIASLSYLSPTESHKAVFTLQCYGFGEAVKVSQCLFIVRPRTPGGLSRCRNVIDQYRVAIHAPCRCISTGPQTNILSQNYKHYKHLQGPHMYCHGI